MSGRDDEQPPQDPPLWQTRPAPAPPGEDEPAEGGPPPSWERPRAEESPPAWQTRPAPAPPGENAPAEGGPPADEPSRAEPPSLRKPDRADAPLSLRKDDSASAEPPSLRKSDGEEPPPAWQTPRADAPPPREPAHGPPAQWAPPQGPPPQRDSSSGAAPPAWQSPPPQSGAAGWQPGGVPGPGGQLTWTPLPPTPGSATAALIFGISAVVVCPLVCPAAILLGRSAMRKIDASEGALGGRGQAKWGMIMGWIGVVLTLIMAAIVAGYYATE